MRESTRLKPFIILNNSITEFALLRSPVLDKHIKYDSNIEFVFIKLLWYAANQSDSALLDQGSVDLLTIIAEWHCINILVYVTVLAFGESLDVISLMQDS